MMNIKCGTVASVKSFIAVGAGAVCLMIPALINRFPFMFPDTADYLIFTPRLYRSPFYGLFLFFSNLNHFIWGTIAAQALIVSHIVWTLVRIYTGVSSVRCFALLIITLTLFSSLPFFVGFLMPDIFTSIMVLVFYILGFHLSDFSTMERLYFVLLACVAIAVHLSHIPLAVALFSVVVALNLVLRTSRRIILIRSGFLFIPIGLAISATLLYNTMVHRVFALFPAGQTFLLANMIEWGPARHYLREVCPAARYKICDIVDALPASANRILWEPSFQKLGGFDGMREEAREIVTATIRTRPMEVLRMALRSFALSLITHAPGAELTPLRLPAIDWSDYWLLDIIRNKFGAFTVQAYKESLQSSEAIPRALLRTIDDIVFPAAIIVLLAAALLAFRSGLLQPVALAVLVSAGFVINSAQSAIIAGVFDRYQARVTWLFPLAALLIIGNLISSRRGAHASAENAARQRSFCRPDRYASTSRFLRRPLARARRSAHPKVSYNGGQGK
jgi:hypothetical protein